MYSCKGIKEAATLKKSVNEIYFIRALACISIVMIHSLTRVTVNYELPQSTIELARSSQLLLLFATPMFILISEFILSYAYPDKLPNGFFLKRVKFILFPYIAVSILYGISNKFIYGMSNSAFIDSTFQILFEAKWHGYFIIIIFQFYLLHYLFCRYFQKIPAWIMIGLSFVINLAYLYIMNFVDPPNTAFGNELWYIYGRLPFPGWIVYFCIGYYTGRNIESFRLSVAKYKFPIILLLAAVYALIINLYSSGKITVISSQRVDILFYSILMFLALFYAFSKAKSVPGIVKLISSYSFVIYLLHPMMQTFYHLLNPEPELNITAYVLTMFSTGLIFPIIIGALLNKIPGGKYIVGNIPSLKRKAPKATKKNQYSISA